MRVRFTLLPKGGVATDVLVEVAAGIPLPAIASELPGLTARALRSAPTIGRPPLIDGAVLGVARRPAVPVPQLRVVGGSDAGAVRSLAWSNVVVRQATGEAAVFAEGGRDVRADKAVLWRATGESVQVSGDPVRLGADDVVSCGGSLYTCVPSTGPRAATEPDGAGGIVVYRPPRFTRALAATKLTFPELPPRAGVATPLALVVGPLVLGLGYWRLNGGDPGYLLLTALAPALYGLTSLSERVSGHRKRTSHRKHQAALHTDLKTAIAVETRLRREAAPDPAAVWLTATEPGARLWERRPGDRDALLVRVGSGLLPATVEIEGPLSRPLPGRRRRLLRRRSQPTELVETPRLPPVPVLLGLGEAGVVGLTGPGRLRRSLARWLLAQVVVHHPPSEVRVVLLCAPAQDGPAPSDWAWARWLPHLVGAPDWREADPWQVQARLDQLADALGSREGRPAGSAQPRYVVVMDDVSGVRDEAGMAQILRAGPAAGIHALCLSVEAGRLPAECTATVSDGPRAGLVLVRRTAADPVTVLVDGVSVAWAEEVARALAPLREPAPASGTSTALPRDVSFRELLGMPAPRQPALVERGAIEIVERWARQPRSTMVPLGAAGSGPFRVDLVGDGPHALVAGTTGAGKSELLQTLVTGLAVGNRPEELALLLVDYKGGAAFGAAASLPHAVGLVTDLDPRLTARALASLRAELRRRETVLARHDAKDLASYQAMGARPGLARLVLVVDEFAALAEELPEFVTGLVDVARRGRSLGVHLVLATQRPAGVVSAEIRANAALRICLRVTEPADSADVLDVADAARIPAGRPGRGLARVGGRIVPVQFARVSGAPSRADRGRPAVDLLPAWGPAGRERISPATRPIEGNSPAKTELDLLVACVQRAAVRIGAKPPTRPWLPPLAERVALDDLAPAGPDRLVFGLADRPSEQRQEPYALDLAAGRSLALLGGARSGRTTALRTLAAATRRFPVSDLQLYVLDGGGGLADLAELAHCGAVVGRADTARAGRLRALLLAELSRRSGQLAAAGLGSVTEQRSRASARLPWMMLLIDSYEGLLAGLDDLWSECLLDDLACLLRDGPAAGLTTVLTGGSGLATGRLSGLLNDRLLLRQDDDRLTGSASRDLPPGRGLTADTDPVEVQLAILGADPTAAAQSAALRRRSTWPAPTCRLADHARGQHTESTFSAGREPIRLRPLPGRITLRELDASASSPGLLLGLGGDAAIPVRLDLAGSPGLLVAGPPRSGRTTTLQTIALGLVAQGIATALIAPGNSPLRRLTEHLSVRYAVTELPQDEQCVVLIDDLDLLADTPQEADIAAAPANAVVIASGQTEALATAYRGPAARLRQQRRGVLLCPRRPSDGDLFGIRLLAPVPQLPGRGILVADGTETPLQIATVG